METTSALNFQIHLQSSSSIRANIHHHSRRRRRHNVCRQSNLAMPVRALTLRRITTTQYHFRFNHPIEAFRITNHFTSVKHHTMAKESKNKDVVQGKVDSTTMNVSRSEKEEKNKASEKSTSVIPPPPEKPLPGDCCGSGCVRCVWDVYYEELEEYNRLYKADSKIS